MAPNKTIPSGDDSKDIEGEPLTTLVPDRYRDQHLANINRYIESGEPSLDRTCIQMPVLHRNGREIELPISFSGDTLHGDRRFAGITRT